MARHRNLSLPLVLLTAIVASAGCNTGPSVNGSFVRTFTVTGPVRLELSNAAGDVDISGTAGRTVSVHADVRASGFGFDNPQKRLNETISNPPVEQRGDTIRIGKEMSRMRNLTITYTIQVPYDTDVDVTVASGAQTIRNVRGPVKVKAASGSIRVQKIERDAQLSSGSGTVSDVKGDVRVSALSGVIRVSKPGARVEADTASGEVEIQGASNDVKAHAASGRVFVQGNPGGDSYWDLKTVSGGVQLNVPASANLRLSADAVSGDIRTDIPIVVEEQGKHSLRAHIGNGGGRVEVHTVSGEICVSGAK